MNGPGSDPSYLRQTAAFTAHTEAGRELLRGLGWPGFAPTRAGDYDDLGWMAEQPFIESPP